MGHHLVGHSQFLSEKIPSGRILSGNSPLLNLMPAQQIRPAMPTWPQVLAA